MHKPVLTKSQNIEINTQKIVEMRGVVEEKCMYLCVHLLNSWVIRQNCKIVCLESANIPFLCQQRKRAASPLVSLSVCMSVHYTFCLSLASGNEIQVP